MSDKFRPLKTIQVTCKECGHGGPIEVTELQSNTAAVNFVANFKTQIKALESERDALVRAQQGFIGLREHDRAEIDRLKAELENSESAWKLDNHRLYEERDVLKAELEECRELHRECHVNVGIWKEDRDLWKSRYEELKSQMDKLSCPVCGSDVDGKNWKSRAEKMAEALSYYRNGGVDHTIAKAALAEFEEGK